MSTAAFDQTQQPVTHGHGSVRPAIGALAVIMVLGAIAVMIGKICSGRKIMGRLQYDFEGWVETKCSSCIDGRVGPPPAAPVEVPEMVVIGESAVTIGGLGNVEPPVVSC